MRPPSGPRPREIRHLVEDLQRARGRESESGGANPAAGEFPAEFEPEDEVARWGQLYSYVFSEHVKHPNEQRELISALVGIREYALNWAHACLGALVEKRFVHTILSTNFDQLA